VPKEKNSLLRILTKQKARLGHKTAHRFKEPNLLPNMGTPFLGGTKYDY
jgi:hypothetical protein